MAEDKLAPYRSDFGLMIEAGFVATKQLDETSAIRLFNAAALLDTESAAPIVGLGYIAMNKLEVKEAEKLFKKAIEMDPGHDLAKAFLGITYLLVEARRDEGKKLLNEAMENTEDPTIVNLVKTSMEWAESDLTKKRAPFFEGDEASEDETNV